MDPPNFVWSYLGWYLDIFFWVLTLPFLMFVPQLLFSFFRGVHIWIHHYHIKALILDIFFNYLSILPSPIIPHDCGIMDVTHFLFSFSIFSKYKFYSNHKQNVGTNTLKASSTCVLKWFYLIFFLFCFKFLWH